MEPLLLVAVVAVLAIAAVTAGPWLRQRRWRRLRGRPFPAAWRAILESRVPAYLRLPPDLRAQLERHVQVFLAEKGFSGCDGLEVTEEMRVTIAAQACLLLLNRREDCFPRLHRILVYPGPFIVERLRLEPSGVLQEHRQALSGESWTLGQVVLSWDDVVEGAANPGDGRNVVLHEFAHQLDQEKGYANGAPGLHSREARSRWARVLGEAYAQLQQQVAWGETTLFSPYGATSPAEFFAVATEVFFEQPQLMALAHPALYAEFRGLYRVDPDKWGRTPLKLIATQ
jgi:Mlc titration factor MtfA (ptsG expression regulator)